MDKKTIIAVVLAVIIIIGSMIIQSVFFPATERQVPEVPESKTPVYTEPALEELAPGEQVEPAVAPAELSEESIPSVDFKPVEEEALQEETYTIETNVFEVTFSNRGGVIKSIQLKEYNNIDGSPVEMVLSRESGQYPFSIHFGDLNAQPVDALFNLERSLTGTKVDFYRDFKSSSGVPFTLRKTFVFKPDDYLIELRISIENSINELPQLNFNGIAYTLGVGPQIGPDFKKLDGRNEYRNYMFYADGKKKKIKVPKDGTKVLESRVTWAAIIGKYFEVIAIPDATQYEITYDTRRISGLHERSSFYFSRPEIKSSTNTDVFRFYLGPKKRDVLLRYNDTQKNEFNIRDLHFEETASTSIMIGWLANILKLFLELFYKVIPNYGVAIIFLTILIKVIFFPLTHKSYESTSRMQALQPKINEIKEKYKSNPQKMNKEVAALYKREKVSPLGGCLPMLLQMPIFFALYNLLSNHFELRGASFLPPWIVDLSAPESVWDFSPFAIPFVGWQDLRILPFIMLVTTFIQSRLMQAPDASSKNMKLMAYMMPAVFFFILYDMPSGLVLYWTMQNFLAVFQQLYTNMKRKKKNNIEGAGSTK